MRASVPGDVALSFPSQRAAPSYLRRRSLDPHSDAPRTCLCSHQTVCLQRFRPPLATSLLARSCALGGRQGTHAPHACEHLMKPDPGPMRSPLCACSHVRLIATLIRIACASRHANSQLRVRGPSQEIFKASLRAQEATHKMKLATARSAASVQLQNQVKRMRILHTYASSPPPVPVAPLRHPPSASASATPACTRFPARACPPSSALACS